MRFLFINSHKPQCGIYQYGKRVFAILSRNDDFDYIEPTSREECIRTLHNYSYTAIILNYHVVLFPWWSLNIVDANRMYYIHHEFSNLLSCVDASHIFDSDPTAVNGIPRPLEVYMSIFEPHNIPRIGSFGFGFENKGFQKIIQLVQSQFKNAIITLWIPFATFGDADGSQARKIAKDCRDLISSPTIQLEIRHDFMPEEDVLRFLASNTINVFLYDTFEGSGRGCSSAIDYAISAGRPIAISNSIMFRHVYSDAICAYKRPLIDIIQDGDVHIRAFKEKWSPDNLFHDIHSRFAQSYLIPIVQE